MRETERVRRRDLPHWDLPGATYFVTACLEGSIPAQGLLEIRQYQRQLRALKRPANLSPEEWQTRNWKLTFNRIDHWLDQSPAVRHLADDRLAKEVMSSLLHFAGERFDLLSLVVMPSHFHWVFRPLESWVASLTGDRTPRERIMQSVKGYCAKQCNKLLGLAGTFWQDESYDHWIRDDAELERVIHYVEGNPVAAGLVARPEDFVYSSAYLRKLQRLEFGAPIRGGRPPGLPVY